MHTRSLPLRPVLWLSLAALATLAGCSAWKVREAAQLARASEPFQATPPSPVASLLVVGDSTAVGTGAGSAQASLPGLLAQRHPGLRVVNRATDGAKYEDFAAQLQQDASRFDAVLVLGGGNDVLRFTPEGKLRAAAAQVATLAKQRAGHVVLMPPGNVGNAPFFWRPLAWLMDSRSRILHAAVREAAAATGAQYVNLYKPRAQDPFAQRPAELHARDGLHPSDAGYALWLRELDTQAGLSRTLAAATAARPQS